MRREKKKEKVSEGDYRRVMVTRRREVDGGDAKKLY